MTQTQLINRNSTQARQRVVALDVARGVAIVGTLLANIWLFASLDQSLNGLNTAQRLSELRAEMSGMSAVAAAGEALHYAVWVLTDGKFLGLLTIMFGIGLEIQRQSAMRNGRSWPGGYRVRALLLTAEGLINYVFIFVFDVLMGYGLSALVVISLLARSEKAQRVWMWVVGTLHVLAMVWMSWGLLYMESEGQLAAPAEENVTDTSDYFAMVTARVNDFAGGRFEVAMCFAMGIAMFLGGARLYRAGLFEASGHVLQRRLMMVGFGVGLPLDVATRLWGGVALFPVSRYVTASVVAFGLLGLIARWYAAPGRGALGARFMAPIGKMALTCYIGQNLVASVLFYGYGLGLARKVAGDYSAFMILGIWALMVVAMYLGCVMWLRKFNHGPAEMVWSKLVKPRVMRGEGGSGWASVGLEKSRSKD